MEGVRIMEAIGHPILRIGTNYIDIRYSFFKPFKVELTYGEENCVLSNSNALLWYNNGSKTKEGISAGVYRLRPRVEVFLGLSPGTLSLGTQPCPLGQYTTVFQVEVMTAMTLIIRM